MVICCVYCVNNIGGSYFGGVCVSIIYIGLNVGFQIGFYIGDFIGQYINGVIGVFDISVFGVCVVVNIYCLYGFVFELNLIVVINFYGFIGNGIFVYCWIQYVNYYDCFCVVIVDCFQCLWDGEICQIWVKLCCVVFRKVQCWLVNWVVWCGVDQINNCRFNCFNWMWVGFDFNGFYIVQVISCYG